MHQTTKLAKMRERERYIQRECERGREIQNRKRQIAAEIGAWFHIVLNVERDRGSGSF